MKELKELIDDIDKCVRCGTCRSICPTTRVSGRETGSARGKLTLIDAYLKGEIGMTEAYLKHLKECTLCGGCRDVCPAGVRTTDIFTAARADNVMKDGLPLAASFVMKNLLDSPRLMPLALKLAGRLKGLVFKESGEETGLISRFSLPVIGNNRLMPPLADTFFLDLPEVVRLSGSRGEAGRIGAPRVAFFAGCGVNYLMPKVGTASLDCMERSGAELLVPRGQVCCGMPAYYSGDTKTARKLALQNIEVFEKHDFDLIATSCATCSHGLKNVFKKLIEDESPEVRARAEKFASRVRDVTELLAGELGFIEKAVEGKGGGGGGDGRIVTYHDPCHLNRNQGIRREPRDLLAKSSGLTYKDMRSPCSCCGLGGGLTYTNYEMSIEITRRKAESVRESGADVVATACPGCIVQLKDGLYRYGVDAKVVHVVELL
jgi:glycolate oxidase iron-sulfur subunit